MNKWLCICLLSLATLAGAESPQRLLIVSDIWPPYVTGEKGKPGFDVETATQVLESLGYEVTFKLVPWKRAMKMVEKGLADVLLDASPNEERDRTFYIPVEPMSHSVSTLFCVSCDIAAPITNELLKGKRLIVNRGYNYVGTLEEDPNIEQLPVDSFEQGFAALSAGRADYYIVNRYVGLHALSNMGIVGIKPMDDYVAEPSPVYLLFSRQPRLMSLPTIFSKSLAAFKKTPEYHKILVRYGLEAE
ncbi:substrate-binding periplasmic protein [Hahella ganghwensis]|uniref:substrate-binding periplasmic protein n=1 Tax=Hahella ganghwensis TaxID=286420 RepID=UPI0003779178|nr:transporter substrate-binding domain-containing protein [Hahella ganghwensis]